MRSDQLCNEYSLALYELASSAPISRALANVFKTQWARMKVYTGYGYPCPGALEWGANRLRQHTLPAEKPLHRLPDKIPKLS